MILHVSDIQEKYKLERVFKNLVNLQDKGPKVKNKLHFLSDSLTK